MSYQTFCVRKASARTAAKQKKQKKQNDAYVTESWRCKSPKFKTVSLTAWKNVISSGKKTRSFERLGDRPPWMKPRRNLSLAHIKDLASKGHLEKNNSIVYWALQLFAQSPRFPLPQEDDSEE